MARIDKKGRTSKAGRFAALPHRVLISSAYGSLDLVGRAVLTELVMMENGTNNGSIWLSVKDGTDRLGLADKRPVIRAFGDLLDRKLIQLTKDAHFEIKAAETSRARCWRISWLVWPDGPKGRRAPCWDFERYVPPQTNDRPSTLTRKRAERRIGAMQRWQKAKSENRLPSVNFTPLEEELPPNTPLAGEDSTPDIPGNKAILPFLIGEDSTPHTDVTMGRGCSAWWETEAEGNLKAQSLLLSYMTQIRPGLARAA